MLRAHTYFTDVSVFALNLSVAMGLALAIDYTLLLLSRFRDELAAGTERDAALVRTMVTAGRTVVFSAVTVGLSMLPLALFPMYFLKSFAYAGVAVVSSSRSPSRRAAPPSPSPAAQGATSVRQRCAPPSPISSYAANPRAPRLLTCVSRIPTVSAPFVSAELARARAELGMAALSSAGHHFSP